MTTGKRFAATESKLDKKKSYSVNEVVALIKDSAPAKFDETVELHFNLGIDPKMGDQQIRGTLTLPHGTGKSKKVMAFVDAANADAAKAAGADFIGTEETIEALAKTGKIEFDVAVAVPAMMPKLAKAAKVLGPRGLMPNPKTDTVGPNIAKMIQEQKAGKLSFKNDATANVHMIVGKVSFDASKLGDNLNMAVEAIRKIKPTTSKGIYIKSCTVTTTMGPGIKLDTGAAVV